MIGSPVEALFSDPWGTLDGLVEGPLHPGGAAATEALLDRAGVTVGTRLLDVGCGAGRAVERAGARGSEAIGLDHSPQTSRALRGDIDRLPIADGAVDVVLAECALCLADDFQGAIAETRRVLGPGGRLALSDVVVESAVDVPEPIAQLMCLTGTRDRKRVLETIRAAGYRIDHHERHPEDLLSMRDRIREAVDYERLLRATGETELLEGIERVERGVEDGEIGYVSVIATPE